MALRWAILICSSPSKTDSTAVVQTRNGRDYTPGFVIEIEKSPYRRTSRGSKRSFDESSEKLRRANRVTCLPLSNSRLSLRADNELTCEMELSIG